MGMYEESDKTHIGTRRRCIATTLLKNKLWVIGTLLRYMPGIC
jgi:hypothetical protein